MSKAKMIPITQEEIDMMHRSERPPLSIKQRGGVRCALSRLQHTGKIPPDVTFLDAIRLYYECRCIECQRKLTGQARIAWRTGGEAVICAECKHRNSDYRNDLTRAKKEAAQIWKAFRDTYKTDEEIRDEAVRRCKKNEGWPNEGMRRLAEDAREAARRKTSYGKMMAERMMGK